MYYLRTGSLQTGTPLFQKLVGGRGHYLFPEREIAKDWASSDVYEKSLIDWCCTNFAVPEKDCLDIGAHCGTYSMELAQKARRVHSFECSPKTFNYLCANIALQGLDGKIVPYNVALGDTAGTLQYYLRSEDGGGNGCCQFEADRLKGTPSIPVEVRTLDSYNFQNISFIKIDVEGFEQQVLMGGRQMLENNGYPKILFESWPSSKDSENIPATKLRADLFEFLKGLGYKITTLNGYDNMFLAEQ